MKKTVGGTSIIKERPKDTKPRIFDKSLRIPRMAKNAARDLYFSWADCTDKLIEAYGDVLKKRKPLM